MEWFLIFAIPEGIIYFIFVLLLGVASTGILNVILGLIGFGVNVACLCIFADALYSIFSEGEYLKIFQLIISGAVLVWMFSILFTSCADEKVVTYETSNECPIVDVVEGYDFNKLPLAAASKNVSWLTGEYGENKIESDGSKSTITRRAYGCYKYLYLTSPSNNYKVLVDNKEVYGEIVCGTGLNAHTYIYRFDIDNGDYIQIKNTKKKDLKVTNIKLYNQIVDDTSERSDLGLNGEVTLQAGKNALGTNNNISIFCDEGSLPQYPDNNKYWVIFTEGTRGGRVELTTVDIDISQSSDAKIEWNKSLVLKDAVANGKYNQYYYSSSSNKWIEYGTYNKFTDYAIDVLGSNLNVVGTNGSLKMEGVKGYSDLK